MNNEIKEILDIENYRNKDGYVENINLLPSEIHKLLDYITNLQEENKFLKLNNPQMNIEHFRIIKENKRKIDNLRKENERLNNIINELETWLKMIPKYFMDKRSLNNGVYIEQDMQKQIDLTLDKLKELKESDDK